jgi:hypothetical protein
MNTQKSSFGYNQKQYLNLLKNLTKVKINSNRLMKDYSLTLNEIYFLNQLDVFEQYEDIPTRTNGIRNGGRELAHPVSVAVFDFYYGSQIILEKCIPLNNCLSIWGNRIFNPTNTKINMGIAKSIFKKVSPDLYSKCF